MNKVLRGALILDSVLLQHPFPLADPLARPNKPVDVIKVT